jgi:PspA associated protein B
MAFWRRPATKTAELDNLNCLALAATLLEIGPRLTPIGTGAICYRASDHSTFPEVEKNALDLLTNYGVNPESAEIRGDDYGFKWLITRCALPGYPSLVTDLRAASAIFSGNDFGAQLLCAMTVFEGPAKSQTALIYLYKRGTVYPFAPRSGEVRDNRLELAVKKAIEKSVPVESDPTRWFPVWDAPILNW